MCKFINFWSGRSEILQGFVTILCTVFLESTTFNSFTSVIQSACSKIGCFLIIDIFLVTNTATLDVVLMGKTIMFKK